jgi:hypothetical protein
MSFMFRSSKSGSSNKPSLREEGFSEEKIGKHGGEVVLA